MNFRIYQNREKLVSKIKEKIQKEEIKMVGISDDFLFDVVEELSYIVFSDEMPIPYRRSNELSGFISLCLYLKNSNTDIDLWEGLFYSIILKENVGFIDPVYKNVHLKNRKTIKENEINVYDVLDYIRNIVIEMQGEKSPYICLHPERRINGNVEHRENITEEPKNGIESKLIEPKDKPQYGAILDDIFPEPLFEDNFSELFFNDNPTVIEEEMPEPETLLEDLRCPYCGDEIEDEPSKYDAFDGRWKCKECKFQVAKRICRTYLSLSDLKELVETGSTEIKSFKNKGRSGQFQARIELRKDKIASTFGYVFGDNTAEKPIFVMEELKELIKKKQCKKEEKTSRSQKKKVLCIETGEVFESINAAASMKGVSSANLSACCNGKSKSAYGFHWEFTDKDVNIEYNPDDKSLRIKKKKKKKSKKDK